jgi:CubicO group peptidase (beta-lactamase class C family)
MSASGTAPDPGAAFTLANWTQQPYSSRAFWHLRELLPTQQVARGDEPAAPFPEQTSALDLYSLAVNRSDGSASTVADVLGESHTDAYVVLQDGESVVEWYGPEGGVAAPHVLMSVTKSVVGVIVGILAERGLLDPAATVAQYLPELAGTGYGDATLRNLLDMRTGVRFREDYTDPTAEFHELDEWIGWRPSESGDAPRGLYRYLATIAADGPHGGRFSYRSTDSDVLGWVCERVAGERMSELMSTLVWGPMGAEYDADLVCDGVGTAVHDGGLTATARDVARFGQLLLDGGAVTDAGGQERQVVPTRWLRQAWGVDSDLRDAFLASPSELWFAGGWYRNQFWFRPGDYGDVLLCLGIHGQMVHVCRRTRTVCVKFSSWPNPQHPELMYDTCAAFDAIGGALSGKERTRTVPGRPGIVAGLHRSGQEPAPEG